MIRVAVAGAAGRLGSVCCAALEAAPDLELACRLERGQDPAAAFDATLPEVLLDVSTVEAGRGLAEAAVNRGISPVVGTSGWSAEQVAWLDEACRRRGLGGLLVPNFSLGAVLQLRFARAAAAHLSCLGIEEVHHTAKRDSPSGTALATAAALETVTGERPPISAVRRDGLVAEQRVRFGGVGETLELVHHVDDRRAYLPGVLLALRRVRQLPGLVVGLSALLD